jgi:hypothetical protein
MKVSVENTHEDVFSIEIRDVAKKDLPHVFTAIGLLINMDLADKPSSSEAIRQSIENGLKDAETDTAAASSSSSSFSQLRQKAR